MHPAAAQRGGKACPISLPSALSHGNDRQGGGHDCTRCPFAIAFGGRRQGCVQSSRCFIAAADASMDCRCEPAFVCCSVDSTAAALGEMHRKISPATSPARRLRRCRVTFRVSAPCNAGETVHIVGNQPALGQCRGHGCGILNAHRWVDHKLLFGLLSGCCRRLACASLGSAFNSHGLVSNHAWRGTEGCRVAVEQHAVLPTQRIVARNAPLESAASHCGIRHAPLFCRLAAPWSISTW
jgi:hypothetical protein